MFTRCGRNRAKIVYSGKLSKVNFGFQGQAIILTEQPEASAKAEAEWKAPTKVEAEKAKAAKPKYTAGQWVGDQVLDPDRIPNGYKFENGRITRQNRREAGRPDGIGLKFGPS